MTEHKTRTYSTGGKVRGRKRTIGWHASCSCGWMANGGSGGGGAAERAARRHVREATRRPAQPDPDDRSP